MKRMRMPGNQTSHLPLASKLALTCVAVGLPACTFETHFGYGEVEARNGTLDGSVPDGPSDASDAGAPSGSDPVDPDASDASGNNMDTPGVDYCENASADVPACELPGGLHLPEVLAADLVDQVPFYGGGAQFPAGRYRMEYIGGCRKLGFIDPFPWTVHALSLEDSGDPGLFVATLGVVGTILLVDDTGLPITFLPGTSGVRIESGAFVTYEECLAANCGKVHDFEFAGGALGLQPDPLANGISEADNWGRPTPTFRLTYLGSCE